MKHKLLLSLLMLAGCGMAKAETIEIGTGGEMTTAQALPVYCYYNYSLSQQIYTASEIGRGGTIKSISFYNASPQAITRLTDIYLKHTSKSSYANGSSWESVTSSNKVFSGTVTFYGGDWTTITLDTPFAYNGTDNLAVLVDDNTGSYVDRVNFRAFETTGCQALASYQDSGDINPESLNLFVAETQSAKNVIRLDIGEGGSDPDPHTGVIEIGSAAGTNNCLPSYFFYKYCLTQQIYTKQEVGGAATLTSISFYCTKGYDTRNLDIYLVHTGKTSFTSHNDWISFSAANKVFSGDVHFSEGQWITIAFDTPFAYNGTNNIALIVDDNTGNYKSPAYFSVFEATNQAIYVYNDKIDFTAENLNENEGQLFNSKNHIRFNAPAVPHPSSVKVTDITSHTAVVQWESEGGLWNLQYKEHDTGDAWTEVKSISSKSYMLKELKVSTYYDVRVQIAGSPSDEGWLMTQFGTTEALKAPSDVVVSTTPTTATLSWESDADNFMVSYRPYSGVVFYDDFENGLDSKGWTVITAGEAPFTNGWYTMQPMTTPLNDSNGSLIEAHSGAEVVGAWSYKEGTKYNADNWLITPKVDLKGTLSFWQVCNYCYPESYEVLISTTGNSISDFTALCPTQQASGVWTKVSIDLSAYEGQQGYIAIRHVSHDNYVIYVDDFCISEGDSENVGQQPWTGTGTTETTLTISGLWPATKYEYQITAMKGDETAETPIATFTTLESNPAPYDLASEGKRTTAALSWTGFSDKYKVEYRKAAKEQTIFFDDFNDSDITNNNGWMFGGFGDGDYTGWYLTEVSSGDKALIAFSWYDEVPYNADNWLITPLVDIEGTLKFWEMAGYEPTPDTYEVLLALTEDFDGLEDFSIVLRPMQEAASNWREVSIDLNPYKGQKGYIAIHHQCYDCDYLLIDDFGIYSTVAGTEGAWKTAKTTTETETEIDGLEEQTKYDWRVTGIKQGEPDATSDIASFATQVPIDLYFYANSDNESTIYSRHGRLANVTIHDLTLKKDGGWHGLCLPFNLNLAGSILEGADVRTAEKAWLTDDGKYLIIDCLTPVTKIRAGTPYIIKWDAGEDIASPYFEEVVINNADNTIYLNDGDVVFNILYGAGSTDSMYFYLADGHLSLDRCALQPYGIQAFVSYFYVNSDLNDTIEGVGLNVGNMDDTMVGIESLTPDPSPGRGEIYNLAGQRLSKAQKGINIVGGRKILVK